jgi:hypothetical protein
MSVEVKTVPSLSYSEFGSLLSINVVIGISALVLFMVLRTRERNKFFYAPLFYERYDSYISSGCRLFVFGELIYCV